LAFLQMKDLKQKTIRGGFARMSSQGANFVLNFGSLMVMARLLGPADYGLVGMVTAVTGILGLFRDFGLSAVAIQRPTLSEDEASVLFFINALIGFVLTALGIALAPAIATFYHDRRLNAVGIQHGAHLQRQMRFTALAVIYTVSTLVGAAAGIGIALAGFGYWALVATNITAPFAITIGCWWTTRWIPRLPRSFTGARSMLRFGGTLTLNGFVAYLAFNLEKILLGRYWGAAALGIYGRAYRLINIPTDNLNTAAGEVTFSALSRLQSEPVRFKSYFLKAYSLVLALTLPITAAFSLFPGDIVQLVLGPKWSASAPILQLLAPTVLVFAMIYPMGWLLYSLGLVERGLKISLVFAPLIITGYVIGLPHGPRGVALAYSAVMVLWLLPHIAWCVHGTAVSFWDILRTSAKPLACAIVAGALAFGARLACFASLSLLPRVALECAVLLASFSAILLFVAGQKALYVDLIRGLRGSPSAEQESRISA
jgi:O-antigen/teichoic acid export membrane protein